MDKRLIKFNSFKAHPWFGRVFKRLKSDDLKIALAFLEMNSGLGKGDFELAVNRMFVDRERPKAWKEILELLTCANSSLE